VKELWAQKWNTEELLLISRQRTLTGYKSWKVSSFIVKFWGFVNFCVSFLWDYYTLSVELVYKSYKLWSKVVMNYPWIRKSELWMTIKVEQYELLNWNLKDLGIFVLTFQRDITCFIWSPGVAITLIFVLNIFCKKIHAIYKQLSLSLYKYVTFYWTYMTLYGVI